VTCFPAAVLAMLAGALLHSPQIGTGTPLRTATILSSAGPPQTRQFFLLVFFLLLIRILLVTCSCVWLLL
jgi:hypothetical protein